jgi:hypothetical protein
VRIYLECPGQKPIIRGHGLKLQMFATLIVRVVSGKIVWKDINP